MTQSTTLLGHFSSKVIEAGWLCAVALTPLFFNPHSARVFEADKTYLLRSLTIIMAIAWVIKKAEGLGKTPLRNAQYPAESVRYPIGYFLWTILFLSLAYFISSLLSPYSAISFKGYYLREEGFLTIICYFIIFWILWDGLKSGAQLESLITTIVSVSFVVSLYGIFQHFSLDPLRAGAKERVTTTLGGPIFAGGYLIMVIPLTIYKILSILPNVKRLYHYLIFGLMLLAQVMCFIFTVSRGPLVGLASGLILFGLTYAAWQRIKWLFISLITVILLGIIFLLWLNLPSAPFPSLKKHFGRLSNITEDPTVKVRLITWKGTDSILNTHPTRLLIGHGVESMYLLYYRHCPKEIEKYEGPEVISDHSHNDTLDLLITTGIIGLLFYYLLIIFITGLAFSALGLISNKTWWRVFGGVIGLCLILGAVLSRFMAGGWNLVGLGLPAGLVVGVVIYLIIHRFFLNAEIGRFDTLTTSKTDTADTVRFVPLKRGNPLLLIGLLSAVLAHFVEIQFGMALTTTRLYFWIYAGIIGLLAADKIDLSPEPPKPPAKLLLPRVLIGGLVISVFSFDLLIRMIVTEGGIPLTHFIILIGLVIVVEGAMFAFSKEHLSKKRWPWLFVGYAGLVLLWSGLFIITHFSLLYEGQHGTSLTLLLYVWVGVNLIVMSFLLQRATQVNLIFRGMAQLLVYLILIIIGGYLIWALNLKEAYARTIDSYKQSIALSRSGRDYYYAELSDIYLVQGNYAEAEKALQSARAINPHLLRHTRKLGRLYQQWGNILPASDTQRNQKYQQAINYYQEVLNQYQSVGRADFVAELSQTIADIYRNNLKDMQQAITAYERLTQLQPPLNGPYEILGELYYHEKRYDDCVRVNKVLTEREPMVWRYWFNLAAAYRESGNKPEARQNAEKALKLAPQDKKTTIEDFIKSL